MPKANNKGGGARKYDRNRNSCKAYSQARRDIINKRNKLLRHLRHHPDDMNVIYNLVRIHNVPLPVVKGIIQRAQAKATAKLARAVANNPNPPVTVDDSHKATDQLRRKVDAKLKAKAQRHAEQVAYNEARIPTMGRAIIDAQREQLGLAPRYKD